MWLVITILVVTLVILFLNYYLGAKLYMIPKNDAYFNNVKEINLEKLKEINPNPKYVLPRIALYAIIIGAFYAVCKAVGVNSWIPTLYAGVLILLYVVELSKSISLNDNDLVLSKFLSKDICIPVTAIDGMYIYSYAPKFMNKHNHTTKLVITSAGKHYKYTPSSLEKQAILNMMKYNFGINDCKMFVAKK